MKISCFTIFRIHKYSIHYLIYFLVISFAQYKEYMICLISFSRFSYVLPAFTFAIGIGIL